MSYLQNLLNSFISAVPSVIFAVLLLIVAFIVAKIAKSLVIKGLKLIKADRYTDKLGITDETTGSSIEFIGKLVFIVVFLLFLPGIFEKLGMQNVSTPIATLVSQFLNYIPNILAAVIILFIGAFVAKIIRQLITPILKRLKVDKLQEKAGIATAETMTISSVIAYVIYVIILIPVIIAAFQALNISAISSPAIQMLERIFALLPNIFVAIAIIIIGAIIAKIIGKLITNVLSGVGADAWAKKLVATDTNSPSKLGNFSLSTVIGEVVKYIIILLFVVEALNVIKLEILQKVGITVIAYLPIAISAIIIMGVALILGIWVEGRILKIYANAKTPAMIAKCVIITVAVFMSLSQLGIATTIVNAAFMIILGALAVAFAISFGFGGRDFAANTMKKIDKK